jgi:hypothetical protein
MKWKRSCFGKEKNLSMGPNATYKKRMQRWEMLGQKTKKRPKLTKPGLVKRSKWSE